MSGELARAVRDRIDWELRSRRWRPKTVFSPSIGSYWAYSALPYDALIKHGEFVMRDERVPIPQRGKG